MQYSAAAREARLANNRTYNSNKHSSSFSRNKIFRHEGFRHEGPKLYFVLREKEPVQILIFHFKQVPRVATNVGAELQKFGFTCACALCGTAPATVVDGWSTRAHVAAAEPGVAGGAKHVPG